MFGEREEKKRDYIETKEPYGNGGHVYYLDYSVGFTITDRYRSDQIMHLKYVYFAIYQLCLNKALKKKRTIVLIKVWNGLYFIHVLVPTINIKSI